MEMKFIPLSVPNFSGNEKEYVNGAVVSEWVSTGGSLVGEFEQKVAGYAGMPAAVACNSGTSGLHLANLVAGVGRGDEVLAPALTFIAVSYTHLAMAVLIQMKMSSAATIHCFTECSKMTWKLDRFFARAARAGLSHSEGWRR